MPGMQPRDVYELTGVSDVRLAPDGADVAYVVWAIDGEANDYRQAIWLAATHASRPPRRFTAGPNDAQPRWSPDGTRLAFVSRREGDKRQLYVIPVAGGEARRLSELKEDVGEPAWSPDGSRIAFTARVPDEAYAQDDDARRAPRRFRRLQYKLDNVGWTGDRRRHVFVVAADGASEPVRLTDGDFEHAHPAWSPDGSRVAFSSSRGEDWDIEAAGDVYVVDATGGAVDRLTDGDGVYYAPAFSRDGTLLACKWTPGGYDSPRHAQIAVVNAATGSGRRLLTTSLDRNCDPYPELREPIWDGDRIVFAIEDRGSIHIYAVSPDGGEPELLLGDEQNLHGYDAAAGRVACSASTAAALAELHVDGVALTEVGSAFAAGRDLVEPERFTAVSGDGSEVDAWMMRPAGFEEGRRYPLLLSIHGGPFAQYSTGFFDEFQVAASAGYAVVFANPRGSSGYSEEWGRAIRGAGGEPGWGTVDYDDLMAVTDEALRRYDFVDPDRLGVLGGSYGGYMTSWIVGHTNRFRAACSERALNHFVSFYGSSDIGWWFKAYFGEFVHDDVDAYLRRSPWSYAKQIETPLLILHSENDLRCDVEQAEQLFTTLRLLRRDVELVRFPGESHELSRSGNPAHRVQRFEVLLEWFDRYLKIDVS
jgi:dipeptidyl aminopeptidase/acylaminoacyl peptidase